MIPNKNKSKQRNTIQKNLVRNAVQCLNHPDAEEVYEAVRQRRPHISKATVYRNLSQLTEQGELIRIDTGQADRFDSRTIAHYHMRCRSCGKIFDAPLPPFERLEDRLGDTGGFLVESHSIEFIGLCPDCKQ